MTEKKTEAADEAVELNETELNKVSGGYLKIDGHGVLTAKTAAFPKVEYPKVEFPKVEIRPGVKPGDL